MTKREFISILIKSLLIVFAIIGIIVTFNSGGFMSSSALLYFTIQSNIWILSIFVVMLILNIIEIVKKRKIVPNWLKIIKFVFTSAITLTFVVFSVLLIPQMIMLGYSSYLFSLGNICVHNLVPILAILDWCLFDYDLKSNKNTFIFGIIMPLYYCIFALVLSTTSVDFGGGKHVPYFFFDYNANTWFGLGNGKFGTFYWIMILVGIVFFISWILMKVKNKIAKKVYKTN